MAIVNCSNANDQYSLRLRSGTNL